MEAAAGQHPPGVRSLGKALACTRPQERPGYPPASTSGSEARVLVINTGGTIGMVQDVKGEGRRRAEAGSHSGSPPGSPPGCAAQPGRVGAGRALGCGVLRLVRRISGCRFCK